MDSKIGLPASTVADDVARVCVKAAGARRSSKLDPHQCVELMMLLKITISVKGRKDEQNGHGLSW
jgi:hypothetical protein